MASNDDKDIAESHGLSWSDCEYGLSEFLDMFILPQLVQVSEGVYGVSDESTLPSGQTLTLHVLKETRMYRAYTFEGEDLLVPLNCPTKVEIRPQNVSLEYDTVEQLHSVFVEGRVKYVRVTKDHVDPSGDARRCIKVGQKLKLEYILKEKEPILMCLDAEDGCEVCLSMDVQGGFQPLADNHEYFVAELADHFPLPVYIQFTSPPRFTVGENSRVRRLLSGLIRVVDELVIESKVIASTRAPGGRKTILTFPRSLGVDLLVPEQLLANDSTYARVCETLNDGVELMVPDDEVIYGTRAQMVREYSCSSDNEKSKHGDGGASRGSDINKNNKAQPQVLDDGVETDSEDSSDPYEDMDERHSYEYIDVEDLHNRHQEATSSRKNSSSCEKSSTFRSIVSFLDKKIRRTSKEEKEHPGAKGSLKSNCQLQQDTDEDGYGYCVPSDEKGKYDIPNMSIGEVVKLLRFLNLGQYAGTFEREQVDGKMLHELDKTMLKNYFQMTDFHAFKLEKVILGTWRPNAGSRD